MEPWTRHVGLKAEVRWDDGVIKQLRLDMKDEFPEMRGRYKLSYCIFNTKA